MKNQIIPHFLICFICTCLTYSAAQSQPGSGTTGLSIQTSPDPDLLAITPDDRFLVTKAGTIIDVKKGVMLHHGLKLGNTYFINDNKHLVTFNDKTIRIIDYTANIIKKELEFPIGGVSLPPISSDGRWLAYYPATAPTFPIRDNSDSINSLNLKKTSDNSVHIIGLPEGRLERSITTEFDYINNVCIENNILAVTGFIIDDSKKNSTERLATYVKFFNLNTGKETGQYQLPISAGAFHTIYFDPTGKYFFAVGEKQQAAINITTGNKISCISKDDLKSLHESNFIFSKDGGRLFIIDGKYNLKKQRIKIFDLDNGVLLYSKKFSTGCNGFCVSPDLKYGFFQSRTNLDPLQGKTLNLFVNFDQKTETDINFLYGTDLSSDRLFSHHGNYLLTYVMDIVKNSAQIQYYNYIDKKIEKTVKLNILPYFSVLSYNPGLKEILLKPLIIGATSLDGNFKINFSGHLNVSKVLAVASPELRLNTFGVLITTSLYQYYLNSTESALLQVEKSTGNIIKTYPDETKSKVRVLDYSTKYIVLHEENRKTKSNQVLVFNYNLDPVWLIPADYVGSCKIFDNDNSLAVISNEGYPDKRATISIYSLSSGKITNEFIAPTEFYNHYGLQNLTFSDSLCVFSNGIYDLSKNKIILNWTILNEDAYLISTAGNYYYATRSMTENLRFTRNNTSLPFRQYDLLYNRPDKVLAVLPDPNPELIDIYHKAYLKRLQKMGFREQDLSADADLPVLKVNTQDLPFETDKNQLALTIEASDPKFLLDRINVWVNDVPVYGRQGISLRGKKLRKWAETLNIPLSAGDNQIQISCLNEKGVESLLEDVSITCNARARKPDLYVLAIGVSEYADPAMNLNYAAKDAADVSALLQTHKEQYGNIYTKTLLNRDATEPQVRQLKSWLAQAQTDDLVILFVSGHGLLDDNLDYFLATYDVDFSNPKEKGIPYDVLEDLLDGAPARQKLILMDACHSGELDKENVSLVKEQVTTSTPVKFRTVNTRVQTRQIGLQNSFELMKELFVDLRRGSGATVISSAGGAEYAIEGDAWKNGVFTYSLIKGLRDRDADLDKNGAVMVSELQDYLAQRVSELTQGQQRPTFRAENITNDWRVW